MHTFNVNEEWPKEYTLLSNDPLAQDCVILINLSVSGRLSVEKLEKTHKALVERWPTLGGELITSVGIMYCSSNCQWSSSTNIRSYGGNE